MAALKYWLWLTSRKGMDSISALTVLDWFITPERAYYAEWEDYEQLPIRPTLKQALLDKKLDGADRILADCERLGSRIMTIQDADYPQRLRQLADPPAVLYIRGRGFHFDEAAAVGIVGAREATAYGTMWAERLGMELSAGGAMVVSGVAPGIDSCAVRGALKGGGPVVCVLPAGVDVPYPARHRYLYEDVAAAGALVTEYPPGTGVRAEHFPQRNRILSGLCLGVTAVECRPFGGTMITMEHALAQDRDLFALPGPVDAPMSEGPNRLIQQGAKLITCAEDILVEYRDRFPGKLANYPVLPPEAAEARMEDLERQRQRQPAQPMRASKGEQPEQTGPALERIPRGEQKRRFTDDELALLATLGEKTRSADELVELTQIPAKRVLSALTMLQVQGSVEEHPGRRFAALVRLEE